MRQDLPNETDWVNLIGFRLLTVQHTFENLQAGVHDVLASKPGVAVFSAQPPSAPEGL
jgi:hypothetical protein